MIINKKSMKTIGDNEAIKRVCFEQTACPKQRIQKKGIVYVKTAEAWSLEYYNSNETTVI